MNFLIGFEESQTVTIELRALGINAFSCDLKDCSGGHPEWHLKMDIFEALRLKKWDFIGLHPVCTKMTLSGNRTYAKGKPKHQERIEATEWTIQLWEYVCSVCDHVYMENPMGAMNGNKRLPKPQIIQPYFFGDEFQKTTCLWLKGLEPLYHNKTANLFDSNVSHVGKGEMFEWVSKEGKQKRQPLWFAQAKGFGGAKAAKDWKETRSKTFPGIANAIANQWGKTLLEKYQKQELC
jgi:hypothetical protein